MKTPEEIKKGLGACGNSDCLECPMCISLSCDNELMLHALAYIQQLESRLAQTERERDAAVDRLSNLRICADCMRFGTGFHKEPCLNCAFETNPIYRPNWQWRGPCPENTEEENE